jgi:hypothetical protein
MEHFYVSTYCEHALHTDCRLNCKVCGSLCRCPCHYNRGANPDLPDSIEKDDPDALARA